MASEKWPGLEKVGAVGSVANHSMKMSYQDGQFLRAGDFLDEQKYHVSKLRDHNKMLHLYGVCDGLEVTASDTYAGCVLVSAGAAVDVQGNSIVLDKDAIVDLAVAGKTENGCVADINLFICFSEGDASDPRYKADEGGFTGVTRIVEKPEFYISPVYDSHGNPAFTEDGDGDLAVSYLLIAAIRRNRDGIIEAVSSTPPGRRSAGVKIREITRNDLSNGLIENRHLAEGAVTADKIAGKTITSKQLASASVNVGAIQTGAVSLDKTACRVYDWGQVTISANQAQLVAIALTEEESARPAGAAVYPLTAGVVVSPVGVNLSHGVTWCEFAEWSDSPVPQFNRYVLVENLSSSTVKVKIIQWYWK